MSLCPYSPCSVPSLQFAKLKCQFLNRCPLQALGWLFSSGLTPFQMSFWRSTDKKCIHPMHSLNGRLLFYQNLCPKWLSRHYKRQGSTLLGERSVFFTFFLTVDKVLKSHFGCNERQKYPLNGVFLYHRSPHCPRKYCYKQHLVSSPVHHRLVNPDTWWKEKKADKQIKQEEMKKDNGERMVIISIIIFIINDFNNYLHLQRTFTCMVSFISVNVATQKSIYLVHLNYLMG